MLLILGVPSRAVMDVMGWSQASMTKFYQHMTPQLTLSIADQVCSLFWPTDGGEHGDDSPSGALAPT